MKLASPHSDRERLLAVVGRVPVEQAHDALIVTEGLRQVRPPAGCTGDCEWGQDCTCSHAKGWGAPRQPRKRTRLPNLSLWRRLALAWQSFAAGVRRT